MDQIQIFTIGFTKKTAEYFFEKLCETGVKRVVDIRLNNASQLSGFAKRDDLRYLLKAICGMDYIHNLELAPTKDILDEYKKSKRDWSMYEKRFLALLSNRRIEQKLSKITMDGSCLLCSEDRPDYCHRRLVAEYLEEKWGNLNIIHIL